MKGLLVYILKNGSLGDCTNGGLSSKVDKAVLIGCGMPEIFEPSEDAPALYLKEWYGSYKAVPSLDDSGYMFGGNYVETSDSRFSTICGHPIKIHDRQEW